MPATVRNRNSRSLKIVSSLLLTSCLAAPAFAADIETVTVTAEKRAEDIQNVPIAVSAFSGADLANKQIMGFKDLQFSIPSVHFSHGNFGPSNFTIRGIGSAGITTSGDAGVSVNLNDIYLASPPLTSANYYDIADLEVLRGPQATLYGRNATGGSINLHTNKPDLDNFKSDVEVSYGNYDARQARAMINLPIVDGELALRVAGFWEQRSGTVKNVYPGLHPSSGSFGIDDNQDGRDDYSIRGTLRWQPSDNTTIDLMVQSGEENDSRIRAQKQMCHRDPSGILGCLPDKLAFEAPNANAGLSRTFISELGPFTPLGPLSIFRLYQVSGASADPTVSDPTGQQIPQNLRTVNNDFNPRSSGYDHFASLTWHQQWADWLSMDLLLGFDKGSGKGQQSYSTAPGANYADFAPFANQQATCNFFFGAPNCTSRVEAAQRIFGLSTGFGANYSTYFAGNIGLLPVSGIKNNGIVGLNIFELADHDKAFDEISGKNREISSEVRFASDFDGPVNFVVGAAHIDYRNYDVQYFVTNAGAFDYPSIVLGAFGGGDGKLLSPSAFNSNNKNYHLKSDAVFGEVYWDITDELRFTGGLRYTSDTKHFEARSILFSAYQPIGTTVAPAVPFSNQNTGFDAYTGRAVLTWKPDLDWTDQTTFYASYARGNRSGGFNPPASIPGLFPDTFDAETLDSYEVGTKNTLPFLGGTLQANLDGWYYTYTGYQIAKIVNRQAVNSNIDTKLWGVEGEFFYAPDENWQFNMNFGYTHTAIGNSTSIDTRSPTANQPNYTLIKDSLGANCAIVNNSGGPAITGAVLNGLVGFPAPLRTAGRNAGELANSWRGCTGLLCWCQCDVWCAQWLPAPGLFGVLRLRSTAVRQ